MALKVITQLQAVTSASPDIAKVIAQHERLFHKVCIGSPTQFCSVKPLHGSGMPRS